jgi:hypothetical protein
MREHIEPRGMVAILGSRQQLRVQEDVERIRNLWEVVPEISGELLTREKCSRVASKKDQQVQIRTVAEYIHPGDDAVSLFIIHIRLHSRATLLGGPE